jgi:O-antigen/teichoic acid export membrane protein
MGLRRQAFAGATWTGLATLATALLQIGQIAVLARLLRPEDFGLMALVVLVIGFTQAFADAGLSGAIIHRQDTTPHVLSTLFWLNIAVGAFLCALLVLAAPLIAAAFAEPKLHELVVLAALSFLVAPVSQQFQTLLQKSLAFRLLGAIDLLTAVAAALVAVATAYADQGVYALLWGMLAGTAARAVALLGIGVRRWRPTLRFRPDELEGYARFGALQMAERSINYLGFNMDKLLIGSLIGVQGLGLYSVCYQLVMKPLQLVAPIVSRVTLPVFALVQTDDARLRAGFLDALRVVAMLMFPIYMGMIVLAEPIVLVVLGPSWQSVVPVLQLLAILGFFYSIGNPGGSLLLAKGRVGLSFLLNVWMIVLYAVAILIGARWSVEGVAAGLAIATACGLFPVGFAVRWHLVRMRPMEYLAAIGPALVGAGIMGVCLVLTGTLTPLSFESPKELLSKVLFGAVIYSAVVVPWQWVFIARVRESVR